MNIQRAIFAAVVAVVFFFAVYNLFNYFSNQSEIQAQKELEAERRATERERQKAAKAEVRQQAEAEQLRKKQEREQQAAERKAQEKAKRQQEAVEREARRQEQLAREIERDEQRLQARITKARTPRHIEGIPEDTIERFNSVSARYIRDKPDEFLKPRFGPKTFGRNTNFERLTQDDTNTLMLYAAISQDTDVLQALLDIAALFNPKPNIIDVLIDAGIDIEVKTENEYTPLLLAASDNRNLEVVERLAIKGANKGVYDAKGRTAFKIVESRIRGEGDEIVQITSERTEMLMSAIR